MASHYDLEEQEQIDRLKAFWAAWGNVITWALVAALAAFAAYNGWQYWERRQALQATALLDELEQAARGADVERVRRVWSDLQAQAPRTVQAQQGALWAARALADAGAVQDAKAAAQFAAERGRDPTLAALARLRLAALELDAGQADAALRWLQFEWPSALRPWAADRRGDVQQVRGELDAARAAYQEAWRGLADDSGYRAIVEAKLNALGVDPTQPEAKP
ncbi:YfgM family protein [Tepidimonas charontis]|uniref:Tetratricopeptide repeat-like domain protein n=1 Tax=Tepidimonas charontis TaxID=2267262 RepID=A0A554XKU4_9BURK|nr:tetratricopeptide repeat protein [Tepidimonas charontis]TSE36455.1 Tetratricopeptide repeat-like domain protein [Tepidimonas charontis]